MQKSKNNGRFAECRKCQRQRNQAWIDANRDRFRHLNSAATNRMRSRHPVKSLIWAARRRAKVSGLEFTITEADLFIPEKCPVLGITLTYGLGRGNGQSLKVRDTRASLDRIDNTKGYTPDNVIVVSFRANRIKSDAMIDELLKVAKFYAKLGAKTSREAIVPAMQPQEKEQERPMLECVA